MLQHFSELDSDKTTATTIEQTLFEDCSILYVDGSNILPPEGDERCEFWQIALPALDASGGVYFGASAGAICAGATIKTALFKGWDDPYANGAISKTYRWSDETYRGAALTADENISIFPHYDPSTSLHDTLIKEKITTLLPHKARVVALADDEALVSGVGDVYSWSSRENAKDCT